MGHLEDDRSVIYKNLYLLSLVVIVFIIGVLTPFVSRKLNETLTADEVYKNTFGSVVEIKAVTGEDESYGSAVCVSNDGKFLTNAHVVAYSTKNESFETITKTFDHYFIRFPDCENFEEVTLEKFDINKDLAIVKLNNINRKLNVLKISTTYETGEKCYAVGNLQNYGVSISEGVISKKAVNIENNGRIINAIQCDLTITEGNSGGALISKCGELIGITTFRTKDLSGKIIYGMSFSIPSNVVLEFIGK